MFWSLTKINLLYFSSQIQFFYYIITMARQPYMGLDLLFPRLHGLRICGSSETSRLAALFNSILMWLPKPSGRQSGDLGEKWPLNFAYETFLFIYDMGPTALLPLRRKWCSGILSPIKIHRPRSGSNPQTLGPVASTLTTSPPRSTQFFYYPPKRNCCNCILLTLLDKICIGHINTILFTTILYEDDITY
jgi:hypothetical protein